MNRFDQVSVSAYTPQSMQELAFTPMMKRAQHDEMSKNLAELDAIATDPLDKHHDEALRLKQEFESKLGNISGELASKGIDGVGKENFYKLKKERDNLIAPTGRIGQINNSKILYNKREDDYIKSAEKENIGRAQALINWREANKGYTGFSEDGKNIKDVGELGASQFQDYDKQIALAHQNIGETIRGVSNSGHHLEKGKDGSYWEVNKNGERTIANNANQINSAKKSFKDSWLKGEGAKWAKEAGVPMNEKRIDDAFDSMLKDSNVYKENVSSSYHEPKPSDGGGGGPRVIDVSNDPLIIPGTQAEHDAKIKLIDDKLRLNPTSVSAKEIIEYNSLKHRKETYDIEDTERSTKTLPNGKSNPKFDKNYDDSKTSYVKERSSFLSNFQQGTTERKIAEDLVKMNKIDVVSKYGISNIDKSESLRSPGLQQSSDKILRKVLSKFDNFQNSRKKLNDIRFKNYDKINDYSLNSMITYDSKDKKNEDLLKTIGNVLQSGKSSGLGQILRFKTNKGSLQSVDDSDENDVIGAQNVMNSIDKIDSFSFNENKGGVPTITINGKTSKGSKSYNPNGLDGTVVGGDEANVSFEIALTNVHPGGRENGSIQPGSLNTEILNNIAHSGKAGEQLAHAIYDRIDKFANKRK